MAKITFSIDVNKIEQHMQDMVRYIEKNILQEAPLAIRDAIVKEVLNQNNWNPAAIYSPHSVQSGKYDLNMSGQLLATIGNESYNTISQGEKQARIGIGNIDVLDGLRSRRGDFGSSYPSDYSKNAPYWRFVVFGHRPPRMDVTFARKGSFAGKDVGDIVPGQPRMAGTPPTYMFSNGLMAAQTEIDKILKDAINNTVKGLNAKWR